MLKSILKTFRNCAYDSLRYVKYSGVTGAKHNRDILRAHILMDTHRIEKGMALPTPRPGFGKDALSRLFLAIPQYETLGGPDFTTEWSRGVLRQYCTFNARLQTPTNEVDAFLIDNNPKHPMGGLLEVRPSAEHERQSYSFEQLALSRHSVRQFAPKSVDYSLIAKAVEISAKTPSVCNRQTGRVHYIENSEKKRKCLEIQGGNRGFGENIPALLVVTSDLSGFLTSGERYQSWIDGGLFAMSMVYALHSLGLGTCMLNWSVDISRDVALKHIVDIPYSQNIICFIAVGHMPEVLTVAASPRFPSEEFVTRHT